MTDSIQISAVLYQEESVWIAQGLEYDITVQAPTLPEAAKRFAYKVAAEIAITLDLGRQPLQGIGAAPNEFWQMFEKAETKLEIDEPPVRIERTEDGTCAPRIMPRMKVAERLLAA